MAAPRVVVTRKLPEAVEARVAALFEAELNPEDEPLSREALARAMREADGLLCAVTDAVDAGLLGAEGRRVRIVANFGVGVNNIDLEAARAAGVAVSNTPGVLTDATADIAIALMLAATRRMSETEAILRVGRLGRVAADAAGWGWGCRARCSGSSAWAGSARRWRGGRRSASGCGWSISTARRWGRSTSRRRRCRRWRRCWRRRTWCRCTCPAAGRTPG